MSNKNTFWNGRRSWDSAALSAIIPMEDGIKGKENAALEAYRKFANCYYEIFNNGCFNWPNYGATYRALCKANGLVPYDVQTLRHCIRSGYDLPELETLGDLIMDAALDEQTNPLRANSQMKIAA